jgi:hypothetical protein
MSDAAADTFRFMSDRAANCHPAANTFSNGDILNHN